MTSSSSYCACCCTNANVICFRNEIYDTHIYILLKIIRMKFYCLFSYFCAIRIKKSYLSYPVEIFLACICLFFFGFTSAKQKFILSMGLWFLVFLPHVEERETKYHHLGELPPSRLWISNLDWILSRRTQKRQRKSRPSFSPRTGMIRQFRKKNYKITKHQQKRDKNLRSFRIKSSFVVMAWRRGHGVT